MELIHLIEDMCNGKLGYQKELKSELKINKVIKHMTDKIDAYLNDVSTNIDSVHFYNRQLALGENNVINLLLILIMVMIEIGKDELTRLILKTIVKICVNNYTTQAQLFIGDNMFFFTTLNDIEELLGAIVMTSIFQKDNQILFTTPELFDTMFKLYKSSLFDI